MIPAYYAARRDRALRGAPLTIYLELLDTLTVEHFLPLKQFSLCVELEYSERTVRNSLKLITKRGYMQRRRGPTNCPDEYRLEFRRRTGDRQSIAAAHPSTL